MKKKLLFLLLCVFVYNNAHGMTYSETTDFPGAVSYDIYSVSVGLLDLGSNTITGSLNGDCINGDCNPGLDDTQDSFLIDIGNNLLIDNIFVTTSNVLAPENFNAQFALEGPGDYTVRLLEPSLPLNGTSIPSHKL